MEFLLESFLHLDILSKAMVLIAIVAAFSMLSSYLSPYKKPKKNIQKYDVEIKGIKGEVHVENK